MDHVDHTEKQGKEEQAAAPGWGGVGGKW